MIRFEKLWAKLAEQGKTRNNLREEKIVSPPVIAKLGKNETVSMEVIDKLCEYLNCQPGDIMSYAPKVNEEELREQKKTIEAQMKALEDMFRQLYKDNGFTEEDYEEDMKTFGKEIAEGKSITEILKNRTGKK